MHQTQVPPHTWWRLQILCVLSIGGMSLCMYGCSSEPAEPVMMSSDTAQLLRAGEEALNGRSFIRALLLADSAVAIQPEAAEPHFLRGMILTKTLRWEEAEAAYESVIERNPTYRGVWNNKGNLAVRQERIREAIRYYQKELSNHNDARPLISLGRAYRELGIVDSAKIALNEAISLDSTAVEAFIAQAQLFEDEGEFERGLYHARRAFEMAPQSPETRYMLGTLLARAGQDSSAIPLLFDVTRDWPWHTESHYTLSQALQRMGRDRESSEILEKAEKLWQRQADVTYFQKSVAFNPTDPYNHAALGTALRMAGRYDEAVDAYNTALMLDGQNLEFKNNLASLYFLQRDTLAAIRTYESIIQQDDSMLNAWLNLGVLQALSGNPQAAANAWQTVLTLDPDHEQARLYLNRLLAENQ